jgi:GcrA cell cycle regulator
MSWTDDRVSLLKRLWGEGRTAAEIAKELGGITRNAVIGKAHRLKLSNRVSPIQQNKKPLSKPLPEKKPRQIILRDENRKTLPLTELNGRMCRWPIGDPQEEGFGFCGDPSVASFPYCADHSRAAYQAATRNRALKAEDLVGRQPAPEGDETDIRQTTSRK